MTQTTALVPLDLFEKGGRALSTKGRRPMSAEARRNISLAMQESAERRRIFLEKKKAYNKLYLERQRQKRLEEREAKLNEKFAALQQDGAPSPRQARLPGPTVPAVAEPQGRHPIDAATMALIQLIEAEIAEQQEFVAMLRNRFGLEE